MTAIPPRMFRSVLTGLLVGLLLSCANGAEEVKGASGPIVNIAAGHELERSFIGFGVEWEYEGDRRDLNLDNPLWTERWPEVLKRVDFMRPSILRVMHDARMYTRLEGDRIVSDYESPRMEGMYRILDFAKSRNIPVLFGEWWLHETYRKSLGSVTDPRWAEDIIVPFLQYLRERRGYTNITYFNLINEPTRKELAPGVGFDFDDWRTAVIHLHQALGKRGLADKILIAGPDGPGDWGKWLERVSNDGELRECIGAYEYHLYAHLQTDKWLPSLLEGKLESDELRPRRLMVNANDPKGGSKPFFMGEAGIDDGNTGDNQPNRMGFPYGVWMADYAIQSMRAGQAGLIAWCLDDAMHTWGSYGEAGLKGWGMWNSLAGFKDYPAGDFKPRPWFYPWSLMCRLFPRGSQILVADATNDPACRVAAARLPDGGGFSFAIVNESSTPRSVSLKMPDEQLRTLHEYRYFIGNHPVNADGFPIPAACRENVKLSAGVSVSLPSAGVVFLTTQKPPPDR